eukprot:5693221-Pleurochrysis_carterae.AAC.1
MGAVSLPAVRCGAFSSFNLGLSCRPALPVSPFKPGFCSARESMMHSLSPPMSPHRLSSSLLSGKAAADGRAPTKKSGRRSAAPTHPPAHQPHYCLACRDKPLCGLH